MLHMPIYTNLEVMLRDIVGYMRTTGSRVLAADDPRRGMIGYQADDPLETRWEIPLEEVRRSPTLITTAQGRRDILVELTRESRAHIITDPRELERVNTVMQRMLSRFNNPPAAPPAQPTPAEPSEGSTVFDRLLKGDMEPGS